jgi:hypothetical protein
MLLCLAGDQQIRPSGQFETTRRVEFTNLINTDNMDEIRALGQDWAKKRQSLR